MVAMSVKQLVVEEGILAALVFGKDVINFRPVSIPKEETAGQTFAVLTLQEESNSGSESRMMAKAGRPVKEIPIIRAGAGSDFDVPPDRGLSIKREPTGGIGSGEGQATSGRRFPIVPINPTGRFGGVSAFGPGQKLEEETSVQNLEHLFAVDG